MDFGDFYAVVFCEQFLHPVLAHRRYAVGGQLVYLIRRARLCRRHYLDGMRSAGNEIEQFFHVLFYHKFKLSLFALSYYTTYIVR